MVLDAPPPKQQSWTSRIPRLVLSPLHRLHAWKSQSQYLGRYSVEKLCAFHEYQETTSLWRVALVVLMTPLPAFAVLLLLDVVPMNDPRAGAAHNGVAFARSVVGHFLLPVAILLSTKQALRLSDRYYSYRRLLLIGVGVSVLLEGLLCIPAAFVWRFPVPFREVTFAPVFMLLVALCSWYVGQHELVRKWPKLKVYLPMVAIQFTMFYTFLSLPGAFTYISAATQIVLVLAFPVVKLLVKKSVWAKAQQLDDLTTDVTICFVELTGALYQTVCLQFAKSQVLQYVILFSDFFQALYEVHAYVVHDYITDGVSTVHTAVQIVISSVFNGADERPARAHDSAALRTLVPTLLGSSSAGGSLFLKPKMIIATQNKRLLDLSHYRYDVDLCEREYAESAAARDTAKCAGVPLEGGDEGGKDTGGGGDEGRESRGGDRSSKYSATASALDENEGDKAKRSERSSSGLPKETRDATPALTAVQAARTIGSGRRPSIERSPRSTVSQGSSQYDRHHSCAGHDSTYGVSRPDRASMNVSSTALSPAQEASLRARGHGGLVLLGAKALPPLRRRLSTNTPPESSRPIHKRSSDTAVSVYDPLRIADAGVVVPSGLQSTSIMAALIMTTPNQSVQVVDGVAAKQTSTNARRKSKRNSTVHPSELNMAVVDDQAASSTTQVHDGTVSLDTSQQQQPPPVVDMAIATEPTSIKISTDAKDGGNQRRTTRVMIDGIQLPRKDQERILEQTLQLLFSCEVLLFVEYLEVLMPSFYGLVVGGLWPLYNARYNMLLIGMTRPSMANVVTGSFAYAALESLSLLVLAYLLKRRYGISALHLLAFVLEKYWKVLHGKMIGALLVVWLTLTVHQGVDFTFTFDYGVILARFGAWRIAAT